MKLKRNRFPRHYMYFQDDRDVITLGWSFKSDFMEVQVIIVKLISVIGFITALFIFVPHFHCSWLCIVGSFLFSIINQNRKRIVVMSLICAWHMTKNIWSLRQSCAPLLACLCLTFSDVSHLHSHTWLIFSFVSCACFISFLLWIHWTLGYIFLCANVLAYFFWILPKSTLYLP